MKSSKPSSKPHERVRSDPEGYPIVCARPDHSISREFIDHNALKVLYRLHRQGYEAYLVGGSVRDLMLGREPKDFDVGTDARPNEIRKVFRNARIIGRRFRLAHVIFHQDVVEVATFRQTPKAELQHSSQGESLVTDDNFWGTPEEDAFRRDFTVNALFYRISDFAVIDYTGGLEDLEKKIIRVIGDPELRFREDPVRMMRACEFAARLDCGMDPDTQHGVVSCKEELRKASVARITEEILQLLRCGACGQAMQWMADLGLLEILMPEVNAAMSPSEQSFPSLLPSLDRKIQEEGKDSLSEIALLAALHLPGTLARRDQEENRLGRPLSRPALAKLTFQTIEPFFERFVLSKLKREKVVEAITGFYRLCEPGWTENSSRHFAHRRFFDDSLALFDLLVDSTGEGEEILDLWKTAFQGVKRSQKQHQRRAKGGRRRRRRGPPRRERRP